MSAGPIATGNVEGRLKEGLNGGIEGPQFASQLRQTPAEILPAFHGFLAGLVQVGGHAAHHAAAVIGLLNPAPDPPAGIEESLRSPPFHGHIYMCYVEGHAPAVGPVESQNREF